MDPTAGTKREDVYRCVGIDPGLNRTGYAVIERTPSGPKLREGGVLTSDASCSLAERVHELGCGLHEVLDQYRPELVAIEQVYSTPRHPKTAVLMAHARGALLYVTRSLGIPIVHYTPAQVKRLLTGSGRASKEQVQFAIQRELHLSEILEPNDVADASAIALCVYHQVQVTT